MSLEKKKTTLLTLILTGCIHQSSVIMQYWAFLLYSNMEKSEGLKLIPFVVFLLQVTENGMSALSEKMDNIV